MKRINRVLIERCLDSTPDLSWMGEYSNQDDGQAIDRKARGDMERHEYRYFNPTRTEDGPEGIEADYQRCEAYNRGAWCMIGIRAVAYVATGRPGHWKSHKIASAGLWGVESDSDEAYLASVGADELESLRSELEELGFKGSMISAAFEAVQTVDGGEIPLGEQFSMND
jgi:hypothetical protein